MRGSKITTYAGAVAVAAALVGCLSDRQPGPPPGGMPQSQLGQPQLRPTTTPTVEGIIRGCAVGPQGQADRRCDPGVRNPRVTQATIGQTICTAGWTDTVRPPTSYTSKLRDSEMLTYYGPGMPATAVREDHLVALELGGHPTDPANLWPQPVKPSYTKNGDSRRLKNAVCRGDLSLDDAQARLLAEWTH